MALPLAESDEPKRFPIQLYHRTATQVDLNGKDVLEVGCGHGGGASYLTRTLHPASYTGLDLNPAGIAFCRARHNLPGRDFVRGDAENLPFPDQSFDAVINIESSHCYPRFPASSPKWRACYAPEGISCTRPSPARLHRPVGGNTRRGSDADAFARRHRYRGPARDGQKFAAHAGSDQSRGTGIPTRGSP
jgi:SAM-dependent methyltransferase